VEEPAPVEPVVEEEFAPAPMATAPEMDDGSMDNSVSVAAVEDHVVYPGETLDDIARTYSVSKSEIMSLNNISDEYSIQEGQTLRIPISE
jgi:hypothetical protein